ncbi:MAG: fibronectin type III domain-containing protein [Elusimicrobia bacterium]|nr:fibronectin type III domain-containing protein [Elusimicrobiota bacterium]
MHSLGLARRDLTLSLSLWGLLAISASAQVPGIPGTPVGVVGSTGSIVWTWTPATDATSYEVALGTKTTEIIATPTSTSTSITGMGPNSASAVVVRGSNTFGSGSFSGWPGFKNTWANPPLSPSVDNVTGTDLTLYWDANGNPGDTVFEVYTSLDDSSFNPAGSGTPASAFVSGLAPATTYYLRVRAYNNDSVPTGYSASISTRTRGTPSTAPDTPVGLALSTSDVHWSWTSVSGATSYSVRLASDATQVLASPTTTNVTLHGYQPNGESSVIVRAVNGEGAGPPSNSSTKFSSAAVPNALTAANMTSVSFELSWNANANRTGTVFEIQRSTDDASYATITTQTGVSFAMYGLTPVTTYYLRVRAANDNGVQSAFSATYSTVTNLTGGGTVPGMPGTPVPNVVSYFEIEWSWAPALDATNYELYIATNGQPIASLSGTSVTIYGFAPNSLSSVTVRGINGVGYGPASPGAYAYTFAGVPAALDVTAVSSDTVSLTWNASGNPAGTIFELQKATDGTSFAAHSSYTQTSVNLTFLAPGTTYQFRVRAYNDDGINTAFSNTASTRTNETLPGIPGAPSAVVQSTGDIKWSWTAAPRAAEYAVLDALDPVVPLAVVSFTSVTLSGLSPNQRQTIVIVGANQYGNGPASSTGSAHSFAKPPTALSVVGVTSIYASLSWNANGNSIETVYELQKSTDDLTYATHSTYSVTGSTVAGLSPSSTYYFKARAINGDLVATAFSGTVSTVTTATGGVPPPGAPSTPVPVVLSSADVSWSWLEVASATSYRVYLSSKPSELIATPPTYYFTLSGRGPNELVDIIVSAVNETGEGPASPSASSYTFAAPPSGLSGSSVTTTTVDLFWSGGGNPAGTVFELQKSSDDLGFATHSTYTALAASVTGLTVGATYYFKVRAYNQDAVATGFSTTYSTRTAVILPGAPGTPTPTVLSTGSLSWTWTAALDASSYQVFSASSPATLLAAPTSNSVSFAGLGANTPFGIRIRGVNGGGNGPLTAAVTAYTFAAPPTALAVSGVTSLYASLNWSAGVNPAGTVFELQRSLDGTVFTTHSTYTVAAATASGLSASTNYWFRVRAFNDDLTATAFSNTAATATDATGGTPPPGAAGAPSAVQLSTGHAAWSWTPASDATGYRVYLATKPAEQLGSSPSSGFTQGGLGPNEPAGIVVIPFNAIDDGPVSSSGSARTWARPPTTLGLTSVSSTSIGLSWNADGNPTGTVFELQMSVDGGAFAAESTTTLTTALAANLLPGTTYDLKVRAYNAAAVATAFSGTVSTVTRAASPGLPGTPTQAAVSTNSVSWTWTPASSATSYKVARASNTADVIGPPAGPAVVFNGLGPNAPSAIVVRGVNSTGDGPLSAAATVYSLAKPPAALTVVSVTSAAVNASWSADGDPAGTVFEVQVATDGTSFLPYSTVTTAGVSVTSLQPATTYDIRVRAYNDDAVATIFAGPVSTRTLFSFPGLTGNPVGTTLSTADVRWAWTASSNAVSYEVRLASDTSQLLASPTTTSVVLAGYAPNSRSYVVVRGVNPAGYGPYSASASAYTYAKPPTTLSGLSVSSAAVDLVWGAAGNAPGTLFEVSAATDGTSFVPRSTSDVPTVSIGGLLAQTPYQLRVRAANGDGVATAYSNTASTQTTPPYPGLPGAPAGTALSTADVSWSWTSASDAISYQVFLATKTSELRASPSGNSVTLSGLGPDDLSSIVVRGVNATGNGPLSAAGSRRTLALPPSTLAVVSVSSASVDLSWNAAGNPASTSFQVHGSTDGSTYALLKTTQGSAASVGALDASTAFQFKLRAVNGDGALTAYSNTVSTQTGPPYPGLPGTPTPTVLSTGGVSWSWTASSAAVSYQVFLASKTAELLASPAGTSATLIGFTPNDTSAIVVRGVNALGTGPYSAPASTYTFAAAPASLAVVSAAQTSVTLSWDTSANPAGTTFELESSLDDSIFSPAASVTASPAAIPSLSAFTTYYFRARARNLASIPTAFSNTASTRTAPALPGAPGTPTPTVLSTGGVSWSWTSASAATSYQVVLASDNAQVIASPTANSLTLNGYPPNALSAIAVRGVNATGNGPFSASSAAYTFALPPSALSVSGVTSIWASLNWDGGLNPAGTRFKVDKSLDNVLFTAHSTYSVAAATVAGLSLSTTYYFRVAALNDDLVATAYSNTASTVTDASGGTPPPGPAGTPSPVVLSTGDVSWSWGAAANAASYKVLLASKTSEVLASPAGTSVVLSGYGPNSLSSLIVRGSNAVDDGPPSAAASAYTWAMPPGTLSLVSVGSASASLSWTSGGNPAGTRFDVETSLDGGAFSLSSATLATTALLPSLSASTTYGFRVRTLNGDSVTTTYSNELTTRTFPPLPGAPGTPTGTALSTADVSWSWTSASDAISYQVFLATKTAELLGAPTSPAFTFSGLGVNALSAVVVRAVNATGDGPLSSPATAYSAALDPASLALVAVGSDSVSVSWNAGANPPLTRFQVQAATDAVSFQTAATSAASSALLTGLLSSTTYDLKVRALNEDAAPSGFSNTVSTLTRPAAPPAPGTPSPVVLSTGDVAWSWTPAATATGYQVFLATKTAELLASPTAASVTLRGFGPNSLSGIVVRALNQTGSGPLSSPAYAYSFAMEPTAFSVVSVTSAAIQLSWSGAGNPAVTVFEIEAGPDGVSYAPFSTTTAVSLLANDLPPLTTYWFRLRASNGDAVGTAFAAAVTTQTLPAPPGPTGTPVAVVASTADIAWSWTPGLGAVSYQVYRASNTADLLASPAAPSFSPPGLGPNQPSGIVVRSVNSVGTSALSASATAYTHAAVPTAFGLVSVTSVSIALSWNAAGNPGGTVFELQGSTDGVGFAPYSTATASALALNYLSPSATYAFRLRAANADAVATAFTSIVSTRTLPPPPGAPGTPAGVALSTADVSWSWAPAPAASSYRVVRASDPAQILAVPSGNSVVLSGLPPNALSGVAVQAVNETGTSSLSAAATAYTLASPPSALNVTAASSVSVSVAWNAGTNAAGTVFEAQISTDGVSFVAGGTTTASSILVASLQSGSSYFLQVRALNGDGLATAFSNTVSTLTALPAPLAPGTPAGTALSTGGVSWTWSPATAAVSYELLIASQTGTILAAVPSTSAVLTGLGPNSVSSVVVRGVNATGGGILSAPGAVYTLAAVPTGASVVSVGSASAVISWSAAGNPAGTVFKAQVSYDGGLFFDGSSGTATTQLMSFLSPMSTYSFQVAAVNGDGILSSYSTSVTTRTMPPAPTAPSVPSATVLSTGGVSWTWGAEALSDSYQLVLATKTSEVVASVSATTAVLTGFGPNSASAVRVRGVNATGPGDLSPPATAYTFAVDPASLVIAAVSSVSASLSWSANGNPAGTVYRVEASYDGGLFFLASTTTASAAAAAPLSPSSTYAFRIGALNGDGVASGYAVSGTTRTLPPPPSAPGTPGAAVLSTGAVQWAWSPSDSADYYEVVRASKTSEVLGTASGTSLVLSIYAPNIPSAVAVRGVNVTGPGPLSAAATAYTFANPPDTLALVSVTSAAVSLSWNGGGNPAGTRFEVQASTDGSTFAALASTPGSSYSAAGLAYSTTYAFQVRALNESDLGTAFSNSVSTMTLPPPPGVPGTPAAAVLSTGSLTWSWTPASSALAYEVRRASDTTQLLASLTTTSLTLAGLPPNSASAIVVLGVNNTGSGPLSAAATAYTFAQAPSSLALAAVSSSAVSVTWSAAGNPAGTVFELQTSVSGGAFAAASTTTASALTLSGLLPSTSYELRVAAANGDAVMTAFSASVATTTFPPLPAVPGSLAGTALSTASVAWSWAAAADAVGYELFAASGSASPLAAGPSTSAVLSGFGPNAPSGVSVRGVNPSGPGPLSAPATVYTLAEDPGALTVLSVGSTTAVVSWSGGANPAGTLYNLEVAVDAGPFVSAATTTAAGLSVEALSPDTTYAFRVRALNADLVATAYSAGASTRTLPALPGVPGVPAGTAVGVSSIQWTWAAASDAAAYRLYAASAPSSLVGSVTAPPFFQTGLSPNSTAAVAAAGVNPTGLGPLSGASSAVYTLANAPSGSAMSAVYATSASISWGLNGNPAWTTAELQRSADGTSFAQVALGTGTARTLTDLLVCTSYYLRVRNLNGDGLPSAFDASVSLLTQPSTPTAPSGLQAAPMAGNRIALSWDPSPSESVTEYRLYWDSGTGTVSYAAPYAVLSSTVLSYTTDVLASSPSFRFVLRAKNRCGIEESNASVGASAPSIASLSGVKAVVLTPQGGKKVKGDALTLSAALSLGSAVQTGRVVFQYRSSSATLWVDIATDTSEPYFVHWNANALGVAVDQEFDIRALAYDALGSTDAAPSAVTVTVVPSLSTQYDIAENATGGKVQKLDNAVANTIQAGGASATSVITKLLIPAGALADPNAEVTVVSDPTDAPSAPSGADAIGVVTKITLSNAQTALSNGKTAAVTLGYPDANGDGMVDGTAFRADRLRMYSAETAAGPWVRDFGSSIDATNRTVTGNTPHFSFFALFVPAAADLSALRIYPVPYMPNNGDADDGVPYAAGNPNSGIVFDNLPPSTTIKVYTVTGQRVAEFGSGSAAGKVQWDVKNDRGQDVASGGYVAVVTSPGVFPVIKKLLVVR